jgi:hypothetical protein
MPAPPTVRLDNSHKRQPRLRGGSLKVLRIFFCHDRQLLADIGRLLFDILTGYFTQAAGRSIHTAMVSCQGPVEPRLRTQTPQLEVLHLGRLQGQGAPLPLFGPGKTAPHSVLARPSTGMATRLLCLPRPRMPVIAVILDPAEIRTIISCLAWHGQGPPTEG